MIFDNELYQEDLKSVVDAKIDWETVKGKKILITGASGMIGTFLVDTFMKRNEMYHDAIIVYALSRNFEKLKAKFDHYAGNPFLKIIEQDISNDCDMSDIDFAYIIHAASNTHPQEYSSDPVGTITTNVFGAYHLLEYARLHKSCRVVILSSVEVYGENRGDVTYFDEKYCGYIDCNTLRAGYPESKRLLETLLQAYITQYGVDGVIIRLSRIYGPTVEADDSKAISQFIHKAVLGEDIVLKSEGNQLYSYTYIADAIYAILCCLLSGKCGEAYNVADDASNVSLKEIAEYLAEVSGRNVVFELPEGKEKRGYSMATKALLNSEKLKMLGWNAVYPIQDGLNRTISILKGKGH